MSNVYVTSLIVGSSEKSIEDAIETAIRTAGKTTRNLEWFEVEQTRGHIVDNRVAHYQVALRLGFRYDEQA